MGRRRVVLLSFRAIKKKSWRVSWSFSICSTLDMAKCNRPLCCVKLLFRKLQELCLVEGAIILHTTFALKQDQVFHFLLTNERRAWHRFWLRCWKMRGSVGWVLRYCLPYQGFTVMKVKYSYVFLLIFTRSDFLAFETSSSQWDQVLVADCPLSNLSR